MKDSSGLYKHVLRSCLCQKSLQLERCYYLISMVLNIPTSQFPGCFQASIVVEENSFASSPSSTQISNGNLIEDLDRLKLSSELVLNQISCLSLFTTCIYVLIQGGTGCWCGLIHRCANIRQP